ncbi:BMP2K kinase, partial [Piaya cayana]|nr:BMP2K kinase [Piaya cayana]
PSPKSSEEEEEQEDEEVLQGENGDFHDDNDTEPENLGHRPLLMDSEEEVEEEEEEKQSSDSDSDRAKQKSVEGLLSSRFRDGSGSGEIKELSSMHVALSEVPSTVTEVNPGQEFDVFGAVPFSSLQPQAREKMDKAVSSPMAFPSLTQEQDDFDVFTKAPFSKKVTQQDGQVVGTEPLLSPSSLQSVDVFGCTPFQPSPLPKSSESKEDLFGLVPFEEITGSQQQQKVKQQRNLQKLSSRQRRMKQEVSKNNGKRHHGTPTTTKKVLKQSFRTPERARRHKKAGRRDSQSSNEFLTISDSKENISVALTDSRDRTNPLQTDESLLDPFGAKPFHPPDLMRHPQHQGFGDNCGDHGAVVVAGRPRQSSLHGAIHSSEGLKTDDFGAVPFTELVVQSAQSQQQQALELDPFGAAPFPSKQ